MTSAPGGDSTTRRRAKREAALASEFLALPPASRERGVAGCFVVPEVGAFFRAVPPAVIQPLLCPRGAVPDFIPRPVEQQYLRPWDAADLARLGLPAPPVPAAKPGRDRLIVVKPVRHERE